MTFAISEVNSKSKNCFSQFSTTFKQNIVKNITSNIE